MTNHLNIDWAGTGEKNRREFNANALWQLQHNPHSSMGQVIESVRHPFAQNPAERHQHLHRQAVLKSSKSQSYGTKLQGLSKASPQEGTAVGRETQLEGDHLEDASPSIEPGGLSPHSKRRAHCHRKHKKTCPKHILNEKSRRDESVREGFTPEYSAVLDDPLPNMAKFTPSPGFLAKRDPSERKELEVPMPYAPVPNSIGKGFAVFLTGCYDANACKWSRKLPEQHPNFASLDYEVDEKNSHLRAKAMQKGRKVEEVAFKEEQKLWKDTVNPAAFRKKNDVKAHMEQVQLYGKQLLREFKPSNWK